MHASLSVIGGKLFSYDNEDEKLSTVGRGGCLNNTRGTQKSKRMLTNDHISPYMEMTIYGDTYMVLTNDHIYVDDDKGGPQT